MPVHRLPKMDSPTVIGRASPALHKQPALPPLLARIGPHLPQWPDAAALSVVLNAVGVSAPARAPRKTPTRRSLSVNSPSQATPSRACWSSTCSMPSNCRSWSEYQPRQGDYFRAGSARRFFSSAEIATSIAASGSLQFPPAARAMKATLRENSSSLRSSRPPLAGIPRTPTHAWAVNTGCPSAISGAHVALSANFGAPATPAEWQTAQTSL